MSEVTAICLSMLFVGYNSEKDAFGEQFDVSWEQLKEYILTHDYRSEKSGAAWSPIELPEGRRASASVLSISCLVFDLDDVSPAQLVQTAQALEGEGITHVAHSTHSHTEESQCLRLVIPLSEPFRRLEGETEERYKTRWVAYRQTVIERFHIPADPACKDLARLYYLPSALPGAPTLAESYEGHPLDPLEPPEPSPAAPGLQLGIPEVQAPIDMAEARLRLKGVRAEDEELVRRILDGEPLAQEGDRDNTVNRAASVLAWQLPTVSVEGVLEILRPAVTAMPGPEGADYWLEKARYSIERSRKRLEEKRVEQDRINTEIRAALEKASSNNTEDNAWRDILITSEDKKGEIRVKSCSYNIGIYFENDPIWRGCFGYDRLCNQLVYIPGPVPFRGFDTLATEVATWFATEAPPADRMWVNPRQVEEQIALAAAKNPIDPLREHLLSLKWDGKSRLDTWLFDYFNAPKLDPESHQSIEAYVSRVGRMWLLGAVNRALEPGCKMDNVLILEGEEGVGKSRALSILGGRWFTDSPLDMGGKDGSLKILGKWIVELAELDFMGKTEPARQRAFITSTSEYFRRPYGKVMEEFPRHCVFAGTVNPEGGGGFKYLDDRINRRWWFVRCGLVDHDKLAAVRDQIWAEGAAVYQDRFKCFDCAEHDEYCATHRFWFSQEDNAKYRVRDQVQQRVHENNFEVAISGWWDTTATSLRPGRVTSTELLVKAIGVPLERINVALQTKLGSAMANLGWVKSRAMVNGNRQYFYVPPDSWLSLPHRRIGTFSGAEAQLPN